MEAAKTLIQVFTLYFILGQSSAAQHLSTMKFTRTKCVNSDFCRPPEGEEIDRVMAMNAGDCLRQCANSGLCAAAAYSKSQSLCLFYDIVWGQDRCQPHHDWTLYNARLLCSETGQDSGPECQCVGGYVGENCVRLVEDCQDAQDSGHYPELAKTIFQDVLRARPRLAPYDIGVACVKGGKTNIMRHHQKWPGNFNRTWVEYVQGFGKPNTWSWLGLKSMYYFTSSRDYTLFFYCSFNSQAGAYKLNYANFSVTENDTYTASVGPFIKGHSSQDVLHDIHGLRFSTSDSYDDIEARDCALLRGGGWWFGTSGCGNYSINGRIGLTGEGLGDPSYTFFGNKGPGKMGHIALMLIRQD